MKKTILGLSMSCCLISGFAHASSPASALASLTKVPEIDATRLAMIDGHDGAPLPTRWHFLTQDPAAENGLREYVVENRQIVANREISQFATELSPADVIGEDKIAVDSDQAALIARTYAAANKMTAAGLNYRLVKGADGSAPIWNVTCLDAGGKVLGSVAIRADVGSVIDHPGFALDPDSARENAQEAKIVAAKLKSRRTAQAAVPKAVFVAPPRPAETTLAMKGPRSRAGGFQPERAPEPVLEGPDSEANRATSAERSRRTLVFPNPERVGSFLRHLIRGDE